MTRPSNRAGPPLAQVVEALLVPEYLQRALPRRRRHGLPAARGQKERVDRLKVGTPHRMALVGGEGQGGQPGLGRPGAPALRGIPEAGGAGKRGRARGVPAPSGEIDRSLALEDSQGIEKQAPLLRLIAGFGMGAKPGGMQLGQADAPLAQRAQLVPE